MSLDEWSIQGEGTGVKWMLSWQFLSRQIRSIELEREPGQGRCRPDWDVEPHLEASEQPLKIETVGRHNQSYA